MLKDNDYEMQRNLRASERAASTLGDRNNTNEPLISSETLERWSEKFQASEIAFGGVSLAALAMGRPDISAAADATGTAAKLAAEATKKLAEAARVEERKAQERRNLERQMRESADRGMKEHKEKMSRGEYRDPPTRESLERTSRIA